MFRNYVKTAIRSLLRNKRYLFINVSGLSIGIAVCFIIFMVIHYEKSFDNFHTKKDRIYRVLTKGKDGDAMSAVPFPLPAALKKDLPQFEEVSGTFAIRNVQVRVPDENGRLLRKFKENSGFFFIEPSFFRIFDFPWLAGDPATSMTDPNSAIITRQIAVKYFGNWRQAIGQTIIVGRNTVLKVTGVLADVPVNTDFQLGLVVPYEFGKFSESTDWGTIDGDHDCFVLLRKNVSVAALAQPLLHFSKRYRTPNNTNVELLQSLQQVHFDQKAGNYLGKTISPSRIRTLWLIAAFILLIACVNFINLSTAQAVNRAREVGVRKVLGSSRLQLKKQFLAETFLLVTGSVIISCLVAGALVPFINSLLDIRMSPSVLWQPVMVLFLVGIIALVTLIAGFYPSVVLSSYNPVTALKTKLVSVSGTNINLRRSLVVVQFIIAQALIIGTLLMMKQMRLFHRGDMGFNKEALVNVPFPNDSAGRSKMDYVRNRLLSNSNISRVSFNSQTPSDVDNWWTDFSFDHRKEKEKFYAISKFADADYLPAYQLPLVAGRNITRTDSIREFLVNEEFVKRIGFSSPEEALNKEIDVWDGKVKGLVVGVIKDFNVASFKNSISPVFISNVKGRYNSVSIKIAGANLRAVVDDIEKLWNEAYPEFVFDYEFMDEKIANFYKQESMLYNLYTCFSAIAIFLSCLGLYGLASFMAVQRLKEVGIRKVLGASVQSIVYLFSKEFILLISIAFLIACPITWYFMHDWLQQYAYRTALSWWVFVAAGAGALLIALTTVGLKALSAANTNPVTNLRTE
ncbi:ABC transporter permease [Longitalea luteola]|uniref:ABC transporter permease n=1 Tax=Longitalea luteola TaxID=2812563 RepID=UPI001A964797|nr:ABC transporter permease [Longitalea luteola]